MDIVSEIGRICFDCGKRKPDFPVPTEAAVLLTMICVCVTYQTGTSTVTATVCDREDE